MEVEIPAGPGSPTPPGPSSADYGREDRSQGAPSPALSYGNPPSEPVGSGYSTATSSQLEIAEMYGAQEEVLDYNEDVVVNEGEQQPASPSTRARHGSGLRAKQ